MKKSTLLTLFTMLNLIGVIVFNLYLPDMVVFNINAKFQITEFIGKWYNIILPILSIVACLIIMLIDVKEQGTKKHVYRYLIAYVAVSVCTYYTWVLLGVQYYGGAIGDVVTAPWTIIVLFPIALFMIANGVSLRYRMFRDASLFKMDMTSNHPIVWQKTHVQAGRMSIFTGLVFCVLAVLNISIWHTLWVYLVAFCVWFVFAFIYILFYAKVVSRNYE